MGQPKFSFQEGLPHKNSIQSSIINAASTRDGFRVYGLIVCESYLWNVQLTPPIETTNDGIYNREKFAQRVNSCKLQELHVSYEVKSYEVKLFQRHEATIRYQSVLLGMKTHQNTSKPK